MYQICRPRLLFGLAGPLRITTLLITSLSLGLLFPYCCLADEVQFLLVEELEFEYPVASATQCNRESSASIHDVELIPASYQTSDTSEREFRITYAEGLAFELPGDICQPDNSPFRMRINSWFQLRHTAIGSDGGNRDQNDFEFERLRLQFGGHVYTQDLRYFLQFDGDSDQSEVSDWLDYYITYDLGHSLWLLDKGRLGLRAGKWKLPFNRARAESGWKMEFADRSMASSFFDINRSVGVGIYGRFPLLGKEVNWESALFNGLNTGGFRPGRTGELNQKFGISGRVFSNLIGDWGSDGEPDLSCRCTPAVRAGVGFAHSSVDNIDGTREFTIFRVVDSGDTLASLLPAGVDTFDVTFFATDLNVKFGGFSFHSEYYFRTIGGFDANLPALFDHGFLLQTGYFILPGKLQLLSRWSRIVGDSGTLGVENQSADEMASGAVWYFRGHEAKLTFDVTHLNGAPIRDTALNILPGDSGWMYRTQVQVKF